VGIADADFAIVDLNKDDRVKDEMIHRRPGSSLFPVEPVDGN
jgi:dihydroorotase-like cyclic amidohydrolase